MKDILMTWITATREDCNGDLSIMVYFLFLLCGFFLVFFCFFLYEEYLHSLTTILCAVD